MVTTIIVIVVAILAIYIAYKFAKKIMKLVFILAVLIGASAYIYFGTDYFKDAKSKELGKNISVENLLKVYCKPDMRASDQLKCDCIIRPLHNDLVKRLSPDEIANLTGRKVLFIKEILVSYKNQRDTIKSKLKERGASDLFAQFKNDIKSGKIIDQFMAEDGPKPIK